MFNEYLEDKCSNHDGSIKKAFDGNELNKLLTEATLLSNRIEELLTQI
jgi:hypothetical protein